MFRSLVTNSVSFAALPSHKTAHGGFVTFARHSSKTGIGWNMWDFGARDNGQGFGVVNGPKEGPNTPDQITLEALGLKRGANETYISSTSSRDSRDGRFLAHE